MPTATYRQTKGRLEAYFDRTAAEAWARLTSDAPVSRVRATVRAGRDTMRATLLGWLPEDLTGRRLLDAGCGAGQLAIEAARRGASVSAVDVAPKLVALATSRAADELGDAAERLNWSVGDMLDPALASGRLDHVVAMDSLIHYRAEDIVSALEGLAARAERSILFTAAPRTPALSAMHAAGKLFPRSDRSPAIAPVGAARLRRLVAASPALADWRMGRDARVARGFYVSHAYELVRKDAA